MRLENTLEYLGLWEQLNNLAFKGVEFDPFPAEAGSDMNLLKHFTYRAASYLILSSPIYRPHITDTF